MLVDNFLYPVSAIRSHFSQSINWSGIRYHLKNGKIHKVSWLKSSADFRNTYDFLKSSSISFDIYCMSYFWTVIST
jgi:hypothetical protein